MVWSSDRQRSVFVGELLKSALDERLARHATHGVQDIAVADAATAKLDFDHSVAGTGQLEHASSGALGAFPPTLR